LRGPKKKQNREREREREREEKRRGFKQKKIETTA